MAKSTTSFKKGNKAALGNPNSGRPKEYDPEVEAAALIEWAKKPDALCLRAFAPHRGYSSESMYKWEASSPVFLQAMDIARDLIGVRREEMLILAGNSKPYERYATMYDKRLHGHERGDKSFEVEIKHKLDQQSKVNPEDEKRFNKLMKQVGDLQSSARNKEESNKSKDK